MTGCHWEDSECLADWAAFSFSFLTELQINKARWWGTSELTHLSDQHSALSLQVTGTNRWRKQMFALDSGSNLWLSDSLCVFLSKAPVAFLNLTKAYSLFCLLIRGAVIEWVLLIHEAEGRCFSDWHEAAVTGLGRMSWKHFRPFHYGGENKYTIQALRVREHSLLGTNYLKNRRKKPHMSS